MYVYKIPIARFALKSMNINSSSMEAHARSKWHISLVGLERYTSITSASSHAIQADQVTRQ